MKLNAKIDKTAFLQSLRGPFFADVLFDQIPDTVFFVKDCKGRYLALNSTLVERCGVENKQALIGRTVEEVFPAKLGQHYAAQDEAVLRSGVPVRNALELHLYPNGREGWCLTWKEPLRDGNGHIVGLVGLSRDVATAHTAPPDYDRLVRVLNYVRDHIDRPLRMSTLAKTAGLSAYQLNRRMINVFGMSTLEAVSRERIEYACSLLKSKKMPISEIALASGYSDQAAFTRHFKKSVSMTPTTYRGIHAI